MADNPFASPPRYEETNDPKNPPNSVLHPRVRSAFLRFILGSLIAVFVLVGIVLTFWMAAHPRPSSQIDVPDRVIGTSGFPNDGGHDPVPRPKDTRDELKFRGF